MRSARSRRSDTHAYPALWPSAAQFHPSTTRTRSSLLLRSASIASRTPTSHRPRWPPIRTNIVVLSRRRTDRLPDPQTHPAGSAPATGKIPSPPSPARSLRVPAGARSCLSPVPALAPAPARNLLEHRFAVFSSAESASSPVPPSFGCSTLPTVGVAVSVAPPPATNGHPGAAAYRIP